MNGLIIQWMHFNDNNAYTQTINLPLTNGFTNANYIAVLTGNSTQQKESSFAINSKTANTITIYHYNITSWDLIAIGY